MAESLGPLGPHATEALAYVDKSIDNVADLDPDLTWRNVEVVSMLEDIRSLLVTGEISPGRFSG
jgi:hypothetical protein